MKFASTSINYCAVGCWILEARVRCCWYAAAKRLAWRLQRSGTTTTSAELSIRRLALLATHSFAYFLEVFTLRFFCVTFPCAASWPHTLVRLSFGRIRSSSALLDSIYTMQCALTHARETRGKNSTPMLNAKSDCYTTILSIYRSHAGELPALQAKINQNFSLFLKLFALRFG